MRKVECEDAVLVFDDTIQEKPYTDENEVMCWHYDHSKGRTVQGFNLLNCLYHVGDISIPVAFELIRKPIEYCDLKTRKRKRASLVTKNELMRSMLDVCVKNKLKFRFVLFDIWFSSKENMCHIKVKLEKDFICALKANRLAALSEEDYQNGRFISIEDLPCKKRACLQPGSETCHFLYSSCVESLPTKTEAREFSIWLAVIQR